MNVKNLIEKFKKMSIALVYDRVNKWGGAERVLLALHELFPNAPLYTSVYNKKTAKWAEVFEVKTSFLQKFPKASSSHELFASLMPVAFESFNFNKYKLVISVTSEAAKGIITKPGTIHICYCLTPTRYLWSGHEDYFKKGLFKNLSKPVVSYLRRWDLVGSKRPDVYISISKEVQKRIKKYYSKESKVIYPPLVFNSKSSSSISTDPYFLLVSRLVPYKRVDIAIEAFNRLKLPFKIVGFGSESKKLKSMAKSNIEFLENLTEEDLIAYYKNCKALIFPGVEDFGLAILEAQYFGKPVIAFRGGGALETVLEGITGEFFDKQDSYSLGKIVSGFDSSKYKEENCIKNTEKFNKKVFQEQFLYTINNLLEYKN